MRQWANMEWVGNESIPEEHVPTDGTAGGEETLRVTTPPAGWTGTQPGERSTLEGIGPMTVHGGWFGPVGNFAFYTVHDDGTGRYVGVNPQDDEPSLAGLTMVPIQISSGAQTADAVAIALETAAAATPYTISRSGNQVDITGPFVAANAAVGGDWSSRGSGHGTIGVLDLQYSSSFGLDTMRFHQIDNSRLPVQGPCRIVGMMVRRGTNIANNFRMCVGLGGVADGDFDTGTIPVQIAVPPNGGATNWSIVMFEPSEVVHANTLTDRIWIGMMGDGAGSSIPAESLGSPSTIDPHFYRDGSNQVLWIYPAPTGSATSFPATVVGSPTSSNTFAIPVKLIVQYPPYYGSAAWRSYFGPTPGGANDTGLSSTSQMDGIWVGWAYTAPNVLGLLMYEVGINLASHAGTQEIRAELWDNVLDPTDPAGETLHHDWGPTSGSATGWNVLSEPGGVAISANTDYRISLKSDGSAPPGDTELAFAAGDHPDQETNPWGWSARGNLGVAQTETEINDTGSVDLWAIYDENTVSTSPNAYTSTLQHDPPTNSGGVYALIGHDGFELTANP